MENTKKIIEPNVLERLKQRESVSDNSLSHLNKKMQKILKRKIDDREETPQYMQALQKYLYLLQEDYL